MYSLEFINIVIKSYNNRKMLNMTVNHIAIFYGISKQSIYNWIYGKINLSKNNKRIYVKSTTKSQYEQKYIDYLLKYVSEHSQFIIKDLMNHLNLLFGIKLSRQIIYMILKSNNITRKRIQINKYPHSNEQYEFDLKKLKKEISNKKNRIISINETAIEINEIHNYGWSKKGKRCIIKKRNKAKGFRFTLSFGISKNKTVGYEIKKGTFKATNFNDFMNKIHVKNGKYSYLLDNASIHRSKLIDKDIKKKMIFNVPYSPQFNPIEYVNNELKRQVKLQNINLF